MDEIQNIQSDQYNFPYHYLPVFEEGKTRLTRQWNWAPSYISALKLISNWVNLLEIPHNTSWRHIDVGCGDGALIYHMSQRFTDRENIAWTGIDYDRSAIQWALMLNDPETTTFVAGDINTSCQVEVYDSATLIEVAEHIPPEQLDSFVKAISMALKPGAELIVTVPHANKTVQKKHYQHFTFESLAHYFTPHFEVVDMKGFESTTRFTKWLRKMIMNRTYVFTWEQPTKIVVNQLAKTFDNEEGIGRILARFRKK